jgi:hypothetical protein
MYPYSHFVWAAKLRDRLGIEHPGEFNLGVVVADMRYIDGTPWAATHIPLEQFWAIARENGKASEDQDFALGYALHLAMDRSWSWLVQQVRRRHLLGRVLPMRVLKLSIEVAMVDVYPLRDIALTERVPPLVGRMGIRPESVRLLRQYADKGLQDPDVETTYEFMQQTGLAGLGPIRLLMALGRLILNTPLRRALVNPIHNTLRDLEPELERRFLLELRRSWSVSSEGVGVTDVPSEEPVFQPA